MNEAHHILLWLAGMLFGASNGKWTRHRLRPMGLMGTMILLGLWALVQFTR